MTDIVAALVAVLKADPDVTAFAGGRVYGGELPRDQAVHMPRAAVVVKPAGGGLLGRGYQDYGDTRVDVDCYGATPRDGWFVYCAVYVALKQLRRTVAAGVLVHSAEPSSRGIPARDPDTDWPLTVSSWQVLTSETEVAP